MTPHLSSIGRRIAPVGHFVLRGVAPGLLVVVALIVVLIVFGNLMFGPERTYVISARTMSVEIEFDGSTTAWSLSDASICKALSNPKRASMAQTDVPCSPSLFETSVPLNSPLVWQKGSRAKLRVTSDDSLEIVVLTALGDIPKNSVIFKSAKYWRKDGVLPFIGTVTVGSTLASGNPDITLGGTYEVRETGLLSRLTEPRTHVVQVGTINRGDQLTIVEGGEPEVQKLSYGHFSASDEDQTSSINATIISSTGDPALSIAYFGGDRPMLVRPDWIDSAIASPILIASAFLISFIANALHLVLSIQIGRPKS